MEKAKKSKSGKSPELKLQMKKAIKKNQKRSKLKGSAKEKRKPVETENESSSRRRSSRLSGKVQSLSDILLKFQHIVVIKLIPIYIF